MRKDTAIIMAVIIGVLFLAGGYVLGKNNIFSSILSSIPSNNPGQSQHSIGGAPPNNNNSANISPTIMNNQTGSQQAAATVKYTDKGFEPAIVTIKKGETVQWINENSNAQMWVASNPHPTHTDYPGFDQDEGVSAGSSYSFTFRNSGVWGYHNHLNPDVTGRVVVI
jgi:plastocyanin